MKRIVLCFDGTWNKPADESLQADQQVETNVSRFYRSMLPADGDGVVQVPWYNEGVGTEWYDHLSGGAFGTGLDHHILSGYHYLVDTYEDGDEIFVVGFSRGAYTARSLVGMLRNCGLVRSQSSHLTPTPVVVGMAYGIYRTREDGPDSAVAQAFRSRFAREVTVRFLGVWDTVGALGIPLHFADRLNLAFYQFHDTALSRIVENAYQAIALDEHRDDYAICLWNPPEEPSQTIEQRWFVGAHADVGGGYADRRLSDLTLRWMQDRVAASGLGVTSVKVDPDNYRGPVTDSYAQFLDGLFSKTHAPYYRVVFSTRYGHEVIDPSINLRRSQADLAYAPRNPGLLPLAD
jgi:uncharacterized protein (DUF2235 family)